MNRTLTRLLCLGWLATAILFGCAKNGGQTQGDPSAAGEPARRQVNPETGDRG